MKKILQFVAFVIVALLVAQPVIAGLPCSAQIIPAGGCTPGCGMTMNAAQMGQMAQGGMSSDYPMSPAISSDGCAQNCCHTGLLQAFAQPATRAKSSAAKTQHFVPAPQILTIESQAVVLSAQTRPGSSAPPLRILFQVFRI